MSETVHIHNSKSSKGTNVFLFLIPAFAFFATLLIYYFGFRLNTRNQEVAGAKPDVYVLGEEDNKLDSSGGY